MEPTTQLTGFAILKNISYLCVFFLSFEYLQLAPASVGILGVLLILDFITGVTRSAYVDGLRSIRSSIALRGALAKLLVILVPFVLALAGKAAGMQLAPVAQASITVFALSTAYSVLGNIHSAITGKPKLEFDAVDYFLQQIKGLLKNFIHDEA